MSRKKIYLDEYQQMRIYQACEYLARNKCPNWLGSQRKVVASCDALYETGIRPKNSVVDMLCVLYAAFYDFDYRVKVFPNDCYIKSKPIKWATTARILALLLFLEVESNKKIKIPKTKNELRLLF